MDFIDAWTDYAIWLATVAAVAEGTLREYRQTMHRWIGFLERQGITWDQATQQDLVRYLARKAATGPRRGHAISANRRRNDVAAIHGFYRYCLLAGHLDRDPFALVRLPRRRKTRQHRSFTLAQLAVILDGARDDDRLYLLCRLGFPEGLRRAEMAHLDLADLIREPWPGALHVVGKGDRERVVEISAKTRQAIERHLGDRANLTAGPLVANYTYPGQPLSPTRVGDLLANHFRNCGIKVGSAHWLRGSTITLGLEATEGANLEEMREHVGHLESRTTRGYGAWFRWNTRDRVVEIMPDPERGQ